MDQLLTLKEAMKRSVSAFENLSVEPLTANKTRLAVQEIYYFGFLAFRAVALCSISKAKSVTQRGFQEI